MNVLTMALPRARSGPPVTVQEIQVLVCVYFELHLNHLLGQRRARRVARPRQIAMYLCRDFTLHSLPQIGRHFGDRDHTTVMHAIATIERMVEEDDEVRAAVAALTLRLNTLVDAGAMRGRLAAGAQSRPVFCFTRPSDWMSA